MEKEAKELQRGLATVDLMTRPSRGGQFTELLLLRMKRLEIRMQPDHHARAHVHIDYGKERHAASFAIDNGQRLVGQMPSKYDREIGAWINRHNEKLSQLWTVLKAGEDHKALLASLKGED